MTNLLLRKIFSFVLEQITIIGSSEPSARPALISFTRESVVTARLPQIVTLCESLNIYK